MAEGRLRERLDRMESTLATLTTKLEKLDKKQESDPKPSRETEIIQLEASIETLKKEISDLRTEHNAAKKQSDRNAFTDFVFGEYDDTDAPDD